VVVIDNENARSSREGLGRMTESLIRSRERIVVLRVQGRILKPYGEASRIEGAGDAGGRRIL
jgi:hypothetical protein